MADIWWAGNGGDICQAGSNDFYFCEQRFNVHFRSEMSCIVKLVVHTYMRNTVMCTLFKISISY